MTTDKSEIFLEVLCGKINSHFPDPPMTPELLKELIESAIEHTDKEQS